MFEGDIFNLYDHIGNIHTQIDHIINHRDRHNINIYGRTRPSCSDEFLENCEAWMRHLLGIYNYRRNSREFGYLVIFKVIALGEEETWILIRHNHNDPSGCKRIRAFDFPDQSNLTPGSIIDIVYNNRVYYAINGGSE